MGAGADARRARPRHDEPGADTIQETELTFGLLYGYVVVDIPGLKKNLGPAADDLAGPVLHNPVHLVAAPPRPRGSSRKRVGPVALTPTGPPRPPAHRPVERIDIRARPGARTPPPWR